VSPCPARPPLAERSRGRPPPGPAPGRRDALSLPRPEPVLPGAGLPGLDAPAGGEPHADPQATRRGAAAGPATGPPGAHPAAAADRAWAPPCPALPPRPRPAPLVDAGGPRSRAGQLLCPASLPGAPDTLATDGFSGINSSEHEAAPSGMIMVVASTVAPNTRFERLRRGRRLGQHSERPQSCDLVCRVSRLP